MQAIAGRLAKLPLPEGPLVAALPMYDWPERRAEVDAQWAVLRDALHAHGIDAPEDLARCNADLPPVPGGILNATGQVIAPDPAALPPDEFSLECLWQHPNLLFAQTCWGPLELWLGHAVRVIGQDDYSGIEGGEGDHYSSAIVMRRSSGAPEAGNIVSTLSGLRFAYNVTDSMSGYIALQRMLRNHGAEFDIFGETIASGGHRKSIRMVAEGLADVAAIDCKSWKLALQHEPAARELAAVAWTPKQMGLPFITAKP
jgi:ABC-type phosphate/phosphonate transport system substrate-binding protein